MTLESGLRTWLKQQSGLEAFWFTRPNGKNAFVYSSIGLSNIPGQLKKTGINQDTYTIVLYHDSADTAKALIEEVRESLAEFSGSLGGYPVQRVSFEGGFDQPLNEAGKNMYQFSRDFTFYH